MDSLEPVVYTRGEYRVTDNREEIDLEVVHHFLCNISYWSKGSSFEKVKRAVDNSLPFGLFKGDEMIGFARLVTDYAYFGYLADVFVLEEHRGQGLGKFIVESILEHPVSKGLRKITLKTQTAQGLYAQYGFEPACPETDMVRRVEVKNG